jgi:hypothetical protein
MLTTIEMQCPPCQSNRIPRNGREGNGKPHYHGGNGMKTASKRIKRLGISSARLATDEGDGVFQSSRRTCCFSKNYLIIGKRLIWLTFRATMASFETPIILCGSPPLLFYPWDYKENKEMLVSEEWQGISNTPRWLPHRRRIDCLEYYQLYMMFF